MNSRTGMGTATALVIILISATFVDSDVDSSSEILMELEEFEITTSSTSDLQGSEKVISDCNLTGEVEWMTDWVPPEKIKQWFPVFRLGLDSDGAAGTTSSRTHIENPTRRYEATISRW